MHVVKFVIIINMIILIFSLNLNLNLYFACKEIIKGKEKEK